MNQNPHGPREAYLVIDGPLKGELRAHDNTTFEVFAFPVPSWMPPARPRSGPEPEPSYVRYWLRKGGDGRLVWSCAAP